MMCVHSIIITSVFRVYHAYASQCQQVILFIMYFYRMFCYFNHVLIAELEDTNIYILLLLLFTSNKVYRSYFKKYFAST